VVSLHRALSALELAFAGVFAIAFVTALGGPFGVALGGPLAAAFGRHFSIDLTFARAGVALALAAERFGTEGGEFGLRLRGAERAGFCPAFALATDEGTYLPIALPGCRLGSGGCRRGGAAVACDTCCGGALTFPKPNLLLHVSSSDVEKFMPTSAVVAEGAAVEEAEGRSRTPRERGLISSL